MPKVNKDPKGLRPYLFHGVGLYQHKIEGDECPGVCPSCGRGDKFSTNIETSVSHCLHGSCGFGKNSSSFIQWLWEESDAKTTTYTDLALDRGLLFADTLMHWGVVKCVLTDRWLIPGYNADGALCQLYVWAEVEGNHRLLATPTLGHQLHHPTEVGGYNPNKSEIYLCEGPWDAMVLWETMGSTKWDADDKRLVATADRAHSLLADANVMAVPGCMTFFESWTPLFVGKTVYLLYDSDHPKTSKDGKLLPPAGLYGMRRACYILASSDSPPASLQYLRWGVDGYDPELPSGTDLRDVLT